LRQRLGTARKSVDIAIQVTRPKNKKQPAGRQTTEGESAAEAPVGALRNLSFAARVLPELLKAEKW